MLTQKLFRRAAQLAAQGRFSEQEALAVLRHILVYDTRPPIFDALLILSPVTEPMILLRFLKSYRHQEVLNGLALLKECGRGDLSAVGLPVLTMYPQRALPTDGYGSDTAPADLPDAVRAATAEADAGDGLARVMRDAMAARQTAVRQTAIARLQRAAARRRGASGGDSADIVDSLAAMDVEAEHLPPSSALSIHDPFPLSALTVGEVQAIVSCNHSNQKTPEEMLAEAEERARNVAAMEALGFSEERIAERLAAMAKDASAGRHDEDLLRLIGGDGAAARGGLMSDADDFGGGGGGGGAAADPFAAVTSGPVILDVDKKWSGLMEAAAAADGLTPAKYDDNDAAADGASSALSWGSGDASGGLSPAEAAVMEEESRAVAAFERRSANASASPSAAEGGFWTTDEAAHEATQNNNNTSTSADTPASSSNTNDNAINNNSNTAAGGEEEGSQQTETATWSSVEPTGDGAAATNAANVPIPTCPPLPPTPLADFDAFFRHRLLLAAERLVRQSRRDIVSHERFFVLGKAFAQMQSASPEALQIIVDRALVILDTVMDNRDALWAGMPAAAGLRKRAQRRAEQRRAEATAAAVARKAADADASGTVSEAAQAAARAAEDAAALKADMDMLASLDAPPEAAAPADGAVTAKTGGEVDAGSALTEAVLRTLNPSASTLTPAFAVSVAASALDFFALALATSSVPSYDPRVTQRRKESAVLSLTSFGEQSAAIEQQQQQQQQKKKKTAPQTDGDGASNTPSPSDTVASALSGVVSKKDSASIGVLGGLHRGVYAAAVTVLAMRDVASLRDISRALAAHVSMIKTGFAIDRTIPMAHVLIAAAHQRLEALLGSIPSATPESVYPLPSTSADVEGDAAGNSNGETPQAHTPATANSATLEMCITLVSPVRALCASNRFPDARLLRVRLATLLQDCIFEADDETFYRFSSIAIAPEGGVYTVANFHGPQRLRMSRVLAFADSAYHRPVPANPRRLAAACDLLRSVGRRRFGLARHAIFVACRAPPRALRDFVDLGRMLQYAAIHPELFNRTHGGYNRILFANAALLGASNIVNDVAAAELSGRSEGDAVASIGGYSLVEPLTAMEVMRGEVGLVRRKRGAEGSMFGEAAIQEEQAIRDSEELRGLRTDSALFSQEEGARAGVDVGSAVPSAADSTAESAEAAKARERRAAFAVRLFQSVGPYRSGIVTAFANEPFLLNWLIANQRSLQINSLIATLRVLARNESALADQIHQTVLKAQSIVMAAKNGKRGGGGGNAVRDPFGDATNGRPVDAEGAEDAEEIAEGALIDAPTPDRGAHTGTNSISVAAATKLLHLNSDYAPQHQQLAAFLLSVLRFRLAKLHTLAFRVDPEAKRAAAERHAANVDPSGEASPSPPPPAVNHKRYTLRNRGAAVLFKTMSNEVLTIATQFENLNLTAKVHVRAIMSLAQRTGSGGYGSLVISHGDGFGRVVFGDGEEVAADVEDAHSVGGVTLPRNRDYLKAARDDEIRSIVKAAKKSRRHIALNFNQLLDPKGLSEDYSAAQMVRLVAMLHEYSYTYGSTNPAKAKANKRSTRRRRAVDAGRAVLPEHWDAVNKALRRRVLNDETPVDQVVGTSLLRAASRIVRDTLQSEEDALRAFRVEEMKRIRDAEGITDTSALWRRVVDLTLPADRIDPSNLKAVEAVVTMARWFALVPPEEQQVFGADHVVHFFRLLTIPLDVKCRTERALGAGHNPFYRRRSDAATAAAATATAADAKGEAAGDAKAATPFSSSSSAADDTAAAANDEDLGAVVDAAERAEAVPSSRQIAFRVAFSRHFPPNSFHSARAKGMLIPQDLYLSLAKQAAHSVRRKRTFDGNAMSHLCNATNGRHKRAYELMMEAFRKNCDKPAGSWDRASEFAARRKEFLKRRKAAGGSVITEADERARLAKFKVYEGSPIPSGPNRAQRFSPRDPRYVSPNRGALESAQKAWKGGARRSNNNNRQEEAKAKLASGRTRNPLREEDQ